MAASRIVHADGWCVHLDIGRQILRLEVPEAETRRKSEGKTVGSPLLPVPPLVADGLVSTATLLLKAKQFDDGLYAAVELAAQRGAGRFPGKAALLRSLAATLASQLPTTGVTAATGICAACELGGVPVAIPELVVEQVRKARDDFLADDPKSKPMGFYTWTPELTAVFRQDRFLQQPLDPSASDDLARALEQTPGAPEAHAACLRLNSRMTNPAKPLGIRDAGKRPAFLPSSRSHEVQLFERHYENTLVPESFELMAELIRRVRSAQSA